MTYNGWLRPLGGRWAVVCEGATVRECWGRLLAVRSEAMSVERTALPAGNRPGTKTGKRPEAGMQLKEYAELVKRLREAQRQYFRERLNLAECITLERQVDEATKAILAPTPDLFTPTQEGQSDAP